MRWFDGLRAESIDSFHELTQALGSRFVTCRRVPKSVASLLSLHMQEGENLKTYSNRYWEMFNEVKGDFDEVAINTFKLGLSSEHGLRKSLTGKPVTNMRQLMDRIDKYKRVEEDQQQGKGKDKVVHQERRDFRSDKYNNNKPCRDYAGQSRSANLQAVNVVFKEPVHQVLEKIKNEPTMGILEDCRSLWDHLEQLVREGKLKQLLHHSSGRRGQASSEPRRDDSLRPPLGTINVILVAPGRTGSQPSQIMSVAHLPTGDSNQDSKRAKKGSPLVLGFSDEDKIGTIQQHDDALVITLRIGGYDVKSVMVDQGSGAEIMYPDLYKGLNLKSKDLTPYSSPLVGFDERVVISRGQIQLPMQVGTEIVEVDFIVMDAYSPYTVIISRSWLYVLEAVPSSLYQKIKYPSEDRLPSQEKAELIEFLKGNIDVFAWNAYEAPRVDPEFICHHLNVNPLIIPKKQPPRCPSKKHADAVQEEAAKLKQARAINEVFYPEWLANTVVVKKKNGK
nr:uncharacterized protein LOC112002276 [Quercus suber]